MRKHFYKQLVVGLALLVGTIAVNGRAQSDSPEKIEAKAKAEAARQARAEADAKKAAEAKAKAEAKKQADQIKKAQAEAKKLSDQKAKTEAAAREKAAEDAAKKAKADVEGKKAAEAKARADAKKQEEQIKKAQAEAKKLAEQKAKAETLARQKAAEDAAKQAKAQAEARSKAEEKAKADAKHRVELQRKAEADARRIAEEQRAAEDAARKKAADQAAKKAKLEAEARKRAGEEAMKKAQAEENARKKAAEAAIKKAKAQEAKKGKSEAGSLAGGSPPPKVTPLQKSVETPVKPVPAVSTAVLGPNLKGISVVRSRDEIQPSGDLTVRGLRVGFGRDLNILRGWEFRELVGQFLGKPITEASLNELQREIVLFYRKNNRPLIDVVIPEQGSIGSGVLQVFVMEARLGRIVVEGNKYFERYIYSGSIRLVEGGDVNVEQLAADVEWLNKNPGRTVDVAFKPGAEIGTSDLVLRVKERYPVRAYIGFENNGTRFTARDRLFAGFNWFNVFGWDHRLNFQYTSDTDFEFLQAFSGSYDIPLPWRHTLTFFSGYAESATDFGTAPLVQQTGHSWQTGVRYEWPLSGISSLKDFRHDLTFGFDFKRFDNNLEFGGVPIVAMNVDVLQFSAAYRASMPDSWGGTSFRAELVHSPGGLTKDNNDAVFAVMRNNARADYWYARFNAQRDIKLPYEMMFSVRGMGQWADGNLVSSEQLGLGGSSTVRGYDEREVNGDQGVFFSGEIYSPPFSFLQLLNKRIQDRMQLLAFFDYGFTHNTNLLPGEDPHIDLASAGVGLRYTMNKNLSVRFDYGFQLIDTGMRNPENSRGNISATWSF